MKDYKKRNAEEIIIDNERHFIHAETHVFFIVSKFKQSKRKFTILKKEHHYLINTTNT